jgi:hypothetical protein
MAESRDPDALTKVDADDLLAAARLADLADDHEREARRLLIGARTTTVLGVAALALFVVLKLDVLTLSAILFLAVVLLFLLGAAWGRWWLFVKVNLDDVRRAVDEDRIIGRASSDDSHSSRP